MCVSNVRAYNARVAGATDLEAVFDRLKLLLETYAHRLVVQSDAPGDYALTTHAVREDGYRPWFGAVQLRKRYVSYHLMPVYVFPDLLAGVSPQLRRRMQGKSCFNFTRVDEALCAELDALTSRGLERFAESELLDA
jgi:hypothetical protein